MQTAVFRIQIADDQRQRHMLKIGEVSKRSGIELVTGLREKTLDKPGRTGNAGVRCQGVGAPCAHQAGCKF